jgi:hypothetical protein
MQNKNADILKEIEKISPFVAENLKESFYKIDSEYFIKNEEKIINRLGLNKQEKPNEDYFNSFGDKLISRIEENDKKSNPSSKVIYLRWAVAASFIVFCFSMLTMNSNFFKSNELELLASNDEIFHYLENQADITDLTVLWEENNDIQEEFFDLNISDSELDDALLELIDTQTDLEEIY